MQAEEDFLYSICLLIQVLLVLNDTGSQAVAYPGQELLLRLPLEECEGLSQVFVNLGRHGNLELVRKLIHEIAKSVDILAVLVLYCN